jgi:hypothetical protein
MVTQTRLPISMIGALKEEQILGLRFCDIEWNLPFPEPYEDLIDQVVLECASKGVLLNLKFFVAKEWLCPENSTAIGIPFYLMHPKLLHLEQKLKSNGFKKNSTPEGSTRKEFLQLLRHEIGHAFDHAYQISSRKSFRRLFGSPDKFYAPEFYFPTMNSKDFVEHLPGHYAQAHPLEDFAETFAVWLSPKSNWRQVYRNRPKALAKLEFIDKQVFLSERLPTTKTLPPLGQTQKSILTLSTHYKRQLRLLDKITTHVNMNR